MSGRGGSMPAMDIEHVLIVSIGFSTICYLPPPATDEFFARLSKGKTRRSGSPSAEPSTSGAYPTSPPPQAHESFKSTSNRLAPPTVEQAATLRHARSLPTVSPAPSPTTDSGTHSGTTWGGGLRTTLEALHAGAGIFPPLQSAVGALISCLDVLEATSKNRQEFEDIATELKTLSQSLMRHIKESNSTRISDCVANVAFSIEQQAKLVSAKRDRGTGRRALEANSDEEDIIRHYRRIEALFRQLQSKTDANLSAWSIANEHLANTRLEALTPAKLASYDSSLSTKINRRTCTDGTRTTVLSAMDDWSHDLNAPDLYWMDGMAGTGKTTIACSFSKILEERKQLAASFFCTRSSPECRQVSRIIPTIAYQLARYSIPFQGALCEVLGNDPDIGTKNIAKQAERLLKEPLEKVKKAIPENLVVVIDALDECEDRNDARLVLDLLFKFAPSLPLKFFVTSRPEPLIYSKMITQSPTSRTVLHLHEIEKSLVKADIELYLREGLSFMSPTHQQIEQLVERSGNLFIYAATLVRYIQPTTFSVDPQERLSFVFAMTPQFVDQYAEVDSLYTVVLECALGEKRLNLREVEDMQLVLRTVLCVQEPVSVDTLATLAGIDTPRRALSALQPLRSVIYFSEDSETVSTLHASFPDFMFNQARSRLYFCDRAKHNQLLAWRCFEVMKSQLRFNICNLESSFIPDADVTDLERRIEKAISPVLWYGCVYWGDHLRLAANSSELTTLVEEFLSTRLLFWMEALNLKKRIGLGMRVLVKVKLWLQAGAAPPGVIQYSDDAHSFITTYAANPVSQSTPHIYISSLPLSPKSSSVYKHYWGRTRGMVSLTGGGMERRETAALATWTVGASVRSVAYSPDGSQVAFGCDDGTIGIRSAYDGSVIVDTFKGHAALIPSISFSPDGTRLVSGSNNGTIRLWNANDGTPILSSFDRLDCEIKSVIFLPDGSRIISGSTDCTIRVWSAVNGVAIGDPFRGHTRAILSIALSPDGLRVVSGSMDQTVRVWNIADGTPVFEPFQGHTDVIRSVDFSPDGTLIASGSDDCTVRLWDARNGTSVSTPLKGHTALVESVVFSPNSKLVVSGANDHTIRVWSTESHTLVAGPYTGHTDAIHLVALSPDGTRIVSASGDRSIRVWNTRSSVSVTKQFEGHNKGVWSVAFSPDGSRLISGSSDQTVRLWDAQSGNPIAAPLKGHTAKIWSVAFSPDGARIASTSADRTIRLWDIRGDVPSCKKLSGHTDDVNSVAFSPDGARIASGSDDCTVRIWSLETNKLVAGPFQGHTKLIMSVVFSPDGTRVASGSFDNTIRVWDLSTNALAFNALRGHAGSITSVAFSPNGLYIASGATDKTIRVWKAADGKLAAGPFTGHTDAVRSIAFSPDGKSIASASYDCSVRLWNSHDGTLVSGPFYGHTRWVTSVTFSPDGVHLASSSMDHSIRIWDTRHRQQTNPSSQAVVHSPLSAADIQPSTASSDWGVKNNGWIVNPDGCLLFWVPPEIRRSLLTPWCTFVINQDGVTNIDMSRALIGEHWRKCYVSG
ncbi:hypothetical protein CTheo_2959 [Ceratobasidium theobromae]|uniref:NACHT domain-containing protein n=1 Tax=Ceratobasidium theobromae TaxID=1582974 RepID=A0A5N5QP88_9AGAM|nr:hypothetical protein CTheo_2959 [Ceratobasidium theobromae]